MQGNQYEFQRRRIIAIARVTPYVMVGHVVNTAVIAITLAGSVQPVPLIIWSAYSCSIALLLLFRHVKNRGRSPRNFQRAAKKVTIYALLLALPWSSLAILYLGSVSQAQELILVALGIGMAACATVLLSAIPPAAFSYMSVILIPSALKCLLLSQNGYSLLGTLAFSYWGCLAALIAKTSRDIREREESELALAERNAQLGLAGRAALVGSYTYDVYKGAVQVSEGYAAIHGLPEGTTETTISEWRARVHPEDLARAEGLRDQAFADRRKEDNAEYRIVLSTGEVRWIERRGTISYREDGRAERVVGVNIDVTARKRTEALLRESEAQYRVLYEDNPSMYFTVDAGGTVLSVNKFGAHALGYTEAELVGQTVLKVVHEEDREAAQQQLGLCARNPSMPVNGEIRKVRRDGSVLWVRETARAVRAPDRRVVILIVCEDVTERKQAEALLKESKTRLSDALTAGLVVAFEWNAVTGRSQRSDNSNRIIGFVDGGRFLQHVHPDDRGNLKTHLRGLSPENPSYALTFRFVRPDGRQVWLEEAARGEFDSTGRLLRIKGLTRDITERKELEDHKNMLISELDHRVKNVLATVSAVASRTQETSSAMAEFVVALDGRIKSMATTHELLSHRRWRGIPLAELVRHELQPYATASNTRIEGPDVVLSADASQTLAMVLHELVTNAAKYGAISTASGRVSVRWGLKRNGHAESWLCIEWEESGGPYVLVPTRSGFGTGVIRELIPYELGGTANLMHLPEGVRCKLEFPAHWLGASNTPGQLATDVGHRVQ